MGSFFALDSFYLIQWPFNKMQFSSSQPKNGEPQQPRASSLSYNKVFFLFFFFGWKADYPELRVQGT